MKIQSVNSGYISHLGRIKRSDSNVSENAKKRHNNTFATLNNYDNINTSIKRNPDARVSFKGGIPEAAAETLANGLKTPLIHRAAEYVKATPLITEALFALSITCCLRPLTIIAMAKTDEEKEKCKYQAAKSISSGVVGLVMTALIGTPIKEAVAKAGETGAFKIPESVRNKANAAIKAGVGSLSTIAKDNSEIAGIKLNELISNGAFELKTFKNAGKNAEKMFRNQLLKNFPDKAKAIISGLDAQHTLKNYEGTVKNVFDKFLQPLFMPLRAKVTIALVPILLGLVGLKKSSSKNPKSSEDLKKDTPYKNVDLHFGKNTKTDAFSEFSGAAKK